jgi:uncharacterized protein (TIGR03067 family)
MTRYVVTALVAGLLLAAAPAPREEDDAKKETEKFQGTWRMVSFEEGGQALPADQVKEFGYRFTFEKDTFTVKAAEVVKSKPVEVVKTTGTYKLDPTKKPKAIDMAITGGDYKGKDILGIYEVGEDTLKWCAAKPGEKDRPKEFTTTKDSTHGLAVLKRGKP